MPAKIRNDKPRGRHFLKEWREACGLSQQALADRIGTTKQSLSRVERHEQPYSQDTLELLADALKTTPAALLTGPPGAQIQEPPPNEAFLALLLAAIFERIGSLGETEAAVLAEAVIEASHMPGDDLAAVSDPVALARAIAAFGFRQASPPKKQ